MSNENRTTNRTDFHRCGSLLRDPNIAWDRYQAGQENVLMQRIRNSCIQREEMEQMQRQIAGNLHGSMPAAKRVSAVHLIPAKAASDKSVAVEGLVIRDFLPLLGSKDTNWQHHPSTDQLHAISDADIYLRAELERVNSDLVTSSGNERHNLRLQRSTIKARLESLEKFRLFASLLLYLCDAIQEYHAAGWLHLEVNLLSVGLNQSGEVMLAPSYPYSRTESSIRRRAFFNDLGGNDVVAPEVRDQEKLTTATDIYCLVQASIQYFAKLHDQQWDTESAISPAPLLQEFIPEDIESDASSKLIKTLEDCVLLPAKNRISNPLVLRETVIGCLKRGQRTKLSADSISVKTKEDGNSMRRLVIVLMATFAIAIFVAGAVINDKQAAYADDAQQNAHPVARQPDANAMTEQSATPEGDDEAEAVDTLDPDNLSTIEPENVEIEEPTQTDNEEKESVVNEQPPEVLEENELTEEDFAVESDFSFDSDKAVDVKVSVIDSDLGPSKPAQNSESLANNSDEATQREVARAAVSLPVISLVASAQPRPSESKESKADYAIATEFLPATRELSNSKAQLAIHRWYQAAKQASPDDFRLDLLCGLATESNGREERADTLYARSLETLRRTHPSVDEVSGELEFLLKLKVRGDARSLIAAKKIHRIKIEKVVDGVAQLVKLPASQPAQFDDRLNFAAFHLALLLKLDEKWLQRSVTRKINQIASELASEQAAKFSEALELFANQIENQLSLNVEARKKSLGNFYTNEFGHDRRTLLDQLDQIEFSSEQAIRTLAQSME